MSIDVRYDDDPATTFTEPWPGDEVVVLQHKVWDEVVVLHKVSFDLSEGFCGHLNFLPLRAPEAG